MTSNVAFERSFAELSNGHEFSIVSLHFSKHYQNKLFRFFCAMVTPAHPQATTDRASGLVRNETQKKNSKKRLRIPIIRNTDACGLSPYLNH